MGSTLFGRGAAGSPRMNRQPQRNAVIDQLQQFASTINGDPQQMVQQIVEERGISNDDYNRIVQGAQNFMRQFGLK